MVTHTEVIKFAKQLDAGLINFQEQNQVFVGHMKIMNACLLESVPGFKVGSPFFPSVDQLTARLAESYLNNRIETTIEAAHTRAVTDRDHLREAIKLAFND